MRSAFSSFQKLVLGTSLCLGAALHAQDFKPLDFALLDHAAFAQNVAGKESHHTTGPQAVVWTQKSRPDFRGIKFGEGRETGSRHLRIGFARPIPIGSVLVSGGGTLSVLKASATYPGDLNDDTQWQPAERLVNGASSHAEVAAGDYALWLLPPATETRALRFSHTPAAGDREMAGVLGGAWMVPERLGNVAPQSLVQSRARDDASAKLVDESGNKTWQAWDNGEQGAALPISPEHPEIVTLTWPASVPLHGLCLLWAGFAAVEIDTFTGADNASLHAAPESSWKRIAAKSGIDPLYPLPLGPHWIPFEKNIQTRALRLRIIAGTKSTHPHLNSKVKDGRRVWLGEVMALAPLKADSTLASLVLPKAAEEPPPIPVKFTLPEAGLVTLVIEDTQHHRVRNLVSETPFPAGENTAWWDGSDDLLRDPEAAKHGVYHIPTRPVAPGTYTVRGLWRKPVELHYEFSIYNAGKPAWTTADNTGCWLTTHTPPTSMAAIHPYKTADGKPLIMMGAQVAEGGHGLQWLREDGTKVGGQHWVGGTWTGAPTLAVDSGANFIPEHMCYVGSVWDGELRLTAKTRSLEDQPVFKTQLGEDPRLKENDPNTPTGLESFDGGLKVYVLAGIAARDGVIACSMIRQNELLFVDAKAGKILRREKIENPRGLTYDDNGRLLVLSGTKLLRVDSDNGTTETLISSGLEDPRHITTASNGNMFITDRGTSHQVKVFSAKGEFVRAIGTAGAPALGKYDRMHMNNPNGIAIDNNGFVWVAEADNYPRRVSVWSDRGKLFRTFYGPTEYGGGGVLDPQDASKFFYKGMEFALDWQSGTDSLQRVFARPDPLMEAHGGHFSPDYPLYANGKRYFTSCYTHNPTGGDNAAFLWRDDGDSAKLVAGIGDAHYFQILRTPEFRSLWPAGTKPDEENPSPEKHAAFVWFDKNNDARPQPDEVKMTREVLRGVTVTDGLSFIVARYGDKTARFAPTSFTSNGVPVYDSKPESLGPAGGSPPSSGGNQALLADNCWTITTNAPAPFSPHGLGGILKGEPRWSYPSAWPGLHASHEAAISDRPGMVVGHTRLLGGFVQGKAGPMFCINGNMGNMYLFTADGLFVATLFHDIRLRPNWAAPVATRNMDVTDVSLHDENFWPSITQTPDGKIFLIDGGRTSLVRVDGLDSLQRLPDQTLEVTPTDLEKSRAWFARAETARQNARGSGALSVVMRAQPPVVDGKLDDWPATTDWASIDRRGIKANFNSNSRPYEVSAAVALSGGKLYAAWRTTEKDLLSNSGETPNALFKTGGCLDLMLQADTDQRLLVTLVKGKPRALLYRLKVPGTTQPVAFGSPWRSIHIDVVEDVTSHLTFAADNTGSFEISLPLETLHWQPKPGDTARADLGVLRGANGQTTQRIYWSNKATAITADVPSEAELTPQLWGKWKIISE
ncbi:hypothetical protein [Prosthecobacter sp.]|uniref:hypothetical protein n=1 Tax=Prosthecobacter sp. TaxID=1965333 RepID=UPI003784E5AA